MRVRPLLETKKIGEEETPQKSREAFSQRGQPCPYSRMGIRLAVAVCYDLVVAAPGGHGEFVDHASDLSGAIDRALASGKPARINVMPQSVVAPAMRLKS